MSQSSSPLIDQHTAGRRLEREQTARNELALQLRAMRGRDADGDAAPRGAAVSGLPADAAPAKKKTNFMELPTPVKYEELQREIMSAFAFDFPPRPLRPRGVPSPGAKPRRAPSRLLASPRDEASRATRPKTTK